MRLIRLVLFFICVAITSLGFADEEYQFEGTHLLINYEGCDSLALKNIEELRNAFLDSVQKSNATILHAQEQIFTPDGFTMLVLLSESHASIHTYPEHNACFIDLFTCGNNCSSSAFEQAIKEYLQPKKVNKKLFLRGSVIKEIE